MQTMTLESLDASSRAEIRTRLKVAKKGRQAVVLDGTAAAWDHIPANGEAERAGEEFHLLLLAVLGHPAPVVAVLRGQVSGFGTALAAAADIRLGEGKVSISTGGVTAALATGSYRMLSNLLGRARADQLVYAHTPLSAEHAVAWSLLNSTTDGAPATAEFDTDESRLLKRAATAGLLSTVSEQLEYDAWLAVAASGNTL